MSRFSLQTVTVPSTVTTDKTTKVNRASAVALCRETLTAAAAGRKGNWNARAANAIEQWIDKRPEIEGSDWQEESRKLARCLRQLKRGGVGPLPFSIFGMDGNSKLLFVTFSALSAFTCPGAGECLNWCYSFTGWRYPATLMRQLQNTLLLTYAPSRVRAEFNRIPNTLPVRERIEGSGRPDKKGNIRYRYRTAGHAPTTFRLYVDGDFSGVRDVRFWMGLIASRPAIQAYGYSKSWDVLTSYHRAGGQWPPNYLLNLSSGGSNKTSWEEMRALPCVRGDFLAVDISEYYHPSKKMGFDRYEDPTYYAAVRQAMTVAGIQSNAFICPGLCGSCTSQGHACGMRRVRVPIVIGIH